MTVRVHNASYILAALYELSVCCLIPIKPAASSIPLYMFLQLYSCISVHERNSTLILLPQLLNSGDCYLYKPRRCPPDLKMLLEELGRMHKLFEQRCRYAVLIDRAVGNRVMCMNDQCSQHEIWLAKVML